LRADLPTGLNEQNYEKRVKKVLPAQPSGQAVRGAARKRSLARESPNKIRDRWHGAEPAGYQYECHRGQCGGDKNNDSSARWRG